MDYLVICAIAFFVSGLTLFSGFGLGTVLMPAFALFFPLPVAVAATAVVHLANNLFKLGLVGRGADRNVLLRFAVPAACAAVAGAWLLTALGDLPPLHSYSLGGRIHDVSAVKAVIGLLIVGFAALELSPAFARLEVPRRYLPLGGLLSGFFGGLSGNQGALRSVFLIKAGLDKESYIATGVAATVLVDTTRLAVYGLSFYSAKLAVVAGEMLPLVLAATLAAFVGAFAGKRLLKKMTLRTVQLVVAACMMLIGAALVAGLA